MHDEVVAFVNSCRLHYSGDTIEALQSDLQLFQKWLAQNQLHYLSVTQSDIEHFLLSRKWCHAHRVRCCRWLKRFFTFCGITENPAMKIRVGVDTSRKLPRVPSRAVIGRIVARMDNTPGELSLRNRLMLELAYGSGLRRKEMALLDVENVNLAGKTLHITGKGDKQRVVPLTSTAMTLIREYLLNRECKSLRGPLLISGRTGGRMGRRSISKIFAQMTGYNTHAFRHACASHMLQNGCNVRYIQELLGHRNLTTTQLYTHIDVKHLAKVVAKSHPRGIL